MPMSTLHSNRPATTESAQEDCSVIELRQYTLHPGTRDTFIELFDREFVESQEVLGSWVIGQFRDLDDPDRVVWLRGFRDMPARADALTAFYGGPVWRAHREAANATIVDSDNVLLLRPESGLPLELDVRPTSGEEERARGIVVATIYYFDAPVDDEFLAFFEQQIRPTLLETGAQVRACLVTEASANNFRLPVREGEHVFVWLAGFPDVETYQSHVVALAKLPRWRDQIAGDLQRRLMAPPEVLRLAPTARSRLQGCPSSALRAPAPR
jgi:hypothetical protein